MGTMVSQITSLTLVYSTIYSRRRSKKTSKLRVTGFCAGNSPVTGEFPTPMASNAENISIWWRHHAKFHGWVAASIMRPLSRGRPRDNSVVHGASEDVPGMTYDVPGVSYPIPWTSEDCPQGVRPADGPGTHSLASTGPFSQAAVHRASGLLRFSQSQRGRIMDRKWGCPQYVRNRKLMSRSCPGNATATLLAALTFFVKNKLILL